MDDNPQNSRQGNLAWGTKAENMADRRARGTGFGGPNQRRHSGAPLRAHVTGAPPVDPRPIPGYSGYVASADGRIFSAKRRRLLEMSARPDDRGYPQVVLYRVADGQNSTIRKVHTLICLAYHGPRPTPSHEVLHGDHDPGNAAESNLRWGTRAENMEDRRRDGRLAGANNGRAKLTDETADEAAALVLAGSRPADVARRLKVDANTVRKAADRRLWGRRPLPAPAPAPEPRAEQRRPSGAGHPMAKLSEDGARSLIRALHSGRNRREAAAEHGVDVATANKIYRGAIWPRLQAYKASLGPATAPSMAARGAKGEDHGHAKLTETQAWGVLTRAHSGTPSGELAAEYGLSANTVNQIKRGQNWPHLHARLVASGAPMEAPANRGVRKRLEAAEVLEIKRELAAGTAPTEVSRRHGINLTTVRRIRDGEIRKDVRIETAEERGGAAAPACGAPPRRTSAPAHAQPEPGAPSHGAPPVAIALKELARPGPRGTGGRPGAAA